ncbi:hypothetical protein ACKF11_13620 [Methylobacillus sp. Pita2]|uniref:hypothetical protein n=1 Tax=Methylobacillus sp. Pita2 TaxID=3383245 RepID=UPI0038B56E60
MKSPFNHLGSKEGAMLLDYLTWVHERWIRGIGYLVFSILVFMADQFFNGDLDFALVSGLLAFFLAMAADYGFGVFLYRGYKKVKVVGQ